MLFKTVLSQVDDLIFIQQGGKAMYDSCSACLTICRSVFNVETRKIQCSFHVDPAEGPILQASENLRVSGMSMHLCA